MIRSIALMGSHRTGKTRLAENLAEKLDYEFVSFSFNPAYKALGIKMGVEVDFDTRIKLQEHAISMYQEALDAVLREGKPFISDRCFLDLIGYTLSELPSDPKPEHSEWLDQYIERCIQLTKMYYGAVFLLRPGIDAVADETSWSADPVVINKVDACMLWAAVESGTVTILPAGLTDLNDRVETVIHQIETSETRTMNALLDYLSGDMKQSMWCGIPVGTQEILDTAVERAGSVSVDSKENYENHPAVGHLCGWFNKTSKVYPDSSDVFGLYVFDHDSKSFIAGDMDESNASLKTLLSYKPVALFPYNGTVVLAVFGKGISHNVVMNGFATSFDAAGDKWWEITNKASALNISRISMESLQRLPELTKKEFAA